MQLGWNTYRNASKHRGQRSTIASTNATAVVQHDIRTGETTCDTTCGLNRSGFIGLLAAFILKSG